jgi:ERF superfamily
MSENTTTSEAKFYPPIPSPTTVNMGASPEIGKLVEDLANAQLEFGPIVKTKENPYFKSMYADLDDIISATRPALAKFGLVVFQLLETSLDGKSVIVHTKLAHKSNQWIESRLTMPIGAKIDNQAIGTASTYGRRYSYQAIIGVAAELDDDGNKNAEEPEKPAKKKYEPKPGKPVDSIAVEHTTGQKYEYTPEGPKPVQKTDEVTGVPKANIPPPVQVGVPALEPNPGDRFPTKEEQKEFVARARKYTREILPKLNVPDPANALLQYITQKTGVTDTKLLTFSQWSGILDGLDKAYAEGKLKETVEF